MKKHVTFEEANKLISPLTGKISWGVKLGTENFLTIEFGRQLEGDNRTPHGEWHLWLYSCAWRIEKDAELLAGYSDSESVIKPALSFIEDVTLRSLDIHSPSWDSVLSFENGYSLRTFSTSSQKDEAFMIFIPGKKVITFGPASIITLEDED